MTLSACRQHGGSVSIEPFALTLRYHPSGSFGSPFTFVCTAVIVGDEARLFAGMGEMTPAVWRALAAALRQHGCASATFERRNRPRPRHRTRKL